MACVVQDRFNAADQLEALPSFRKAFALVRDQVPAVAKAIPNEAMAEWAYVMAITRSYTFADTLGAW